MRKINLIIITILAVASGIFVFTNQVVDLDKVSEEKERTDLLLITYENKFESLIKDEYYSFSREVMSYKDYRASFLEKKRKYEQQFLKITENISSYDKSDLIKLIEQARVESQLSSEYFTLYDEFLHELIHIPLGATNSNQNLNKNLTYLASTNALDCDQILMDCYKSVRKSYDRCVKNFCSGSNSSSECKFICQVDYERDLLDCRYEYNDCKRN